MNVIWVLIFVALTGVQLGYGLPLGTPPSNPQDEGSLSNGVSTGWYSESALYATVPALALVLTAVSLLFGCAWCYRHKDCKLFSASVSQLHDASRRAQPDSGFSEPANNNVSEDNNNGPISLREMQNIANNNAAAYIVSENEERNRASRESVVEFEPLPEIGAPDPLEGYADWFGNEDFPRDRLQYLREIGRGWFGRVVHGEVEGEQSPVAVKILNQQASPEDKARFLREARVYRDARHENVLGLVARCLREDPWILVFELCHTDLQQYLIASRPNMAALMESGAPLRLVCDVTSALSFLHERGFLYGNLRAENVLVRGEGESARCVLGQYTDHVDERTADTMEGDVWSLGVLLWEAWSWGAAAAAPPLPEPAAPCLYRAHMYQVMQLCWAARAGARPSAAQVLALLLHLRGSHERGERPAGHGSSDFEERWQRLKPNSIPVVDEHVALVHASSSHGPDPHRLAVEPVSRSSSILSEEPLSDQMKSESMTNLHGSLDDVRNIYLTHNEAAAVECTQANGEPAGGCVDPWLQDLLAGSQDDVSYYRDVSDVIKNLDNILNSEKTSSSESSHQASPSRDNLSLDCKREFPVQSSLVKSPGIRNFQNLGTDFGDDEAFVEEELDRDTMGTLSHSFERHSDTTSQHTLANLTPDTPNREFEQIYQESIQETDVEMPNEKVVSDSENDMCLDVSENVESEETEDCQTCDIVEAKTYHLSLEPLVTKSADETTNDKETDRSSAGVTEIPLEETKLDSQGNVVIDMESLDETVSSELPLITRSEVVECHVQIESQVPDSIRRLTEAFLIDQVNHASAQIEDRINDNVSDNNVEKEAPVNEINHNESTEMTDVIRESEIIVDYVIAAATDALTPKKIEETCSNGIDHELNEIPIVVRTVQSQDNSPNKEDESTLVETINEVTDIKESIDSHSPIINPVHLSPSRLRDDDVTDVSESIEDRSLDTASTFPIGSVPVVVHTTNNQHVGVDSLDEVENRSISPSRIPNESTVYMDLVNTTAMAINKGDTMSDTLKQVINTCVVNAPENETACTLVREDSTMYMDLPSVMNVTHDFLHNERVVYHDAKPAFIDVTASTPKNNQELEQKEKREEGAKTPHGSGVAQMQERCVENVSPFDSPTRSHPTETYDDNSSLVLGPFEHCSLELFKAKATPADIEIPKEELLAFSSNFSEMNLATPSPLRDVNFLNEVPDIEVNQARDESLTETENKQESCESECGPSTPPNSPGNFLASSSQKYVVSDTPRAQVDIDQIELQITSKLAMAENENNMNIEYSGPLTVEGTDGIPETFLAGNGSALRDVRGERDVRDVRDVDDVRDVRAALALDEDCMRALRDELELKLPLAQVASIEPAEELEPSESSSEAEAWRAPETIVTYLGALSPIAEETGGQLSAYDSDVAWNASSRTDTSSYLEPCGDSTDEAPELPPAAGSSGSSGSSGGAGSSGTNHDTYTVRSRRTETGQELPSKQVTEMSADSLNSSPARCPQDAASPGLDGLDRTYNVDDKLQCDMISQVSPFLLSPSDGSAPEDTENAAGVSIVSKTTAPTDTNSTKPTETQCLSKATSIDSWCSNDTLFNVEEDFDDLAEVNLVFDNKDDDNSESTRTLNDKEPSHCSTYIVHDDPDKSDCDSFTPDSISANHTYTKPKVDETPIVVTSDVNDSCPANTQTRDFAYGTLVSNPTSCTTDYMSTHDELWRLPQPEMVRRSPIANETLHLTRPTEESKNYIEEPSPKLKHDQMMKKMDSVEITCLQDSSNEHIVSDPAIVKESQVSNEDHQVGNEVCQVSNEEPKVGTEDPEVESEVPQAAVQQTEAVTKEAHVVPVDANSIEITYSPDFHFRNMAHSVQSTPLVEVEDDSGEVEGTNLALPDNNNDNSVSPLNVPNFRMFMNSAELRPQDISPLQPNSQDTGLLLETESKISDQVSAIDRSTNFASFEASAIFKPQELRSSQDGSAVSSNEEFRIFENSVRGRPQDLSAASILLQSELKSNELATGSSTNMEFDHTSQHFTQNGFSANFDESRSAGHYGFVTNSDYDENEQPHSIIIPESLTPAGNRTYDSHENAENRTFESHTHRGLQYNSDLQNDTTGSPHVNVDTFSPKDANVSRRDDTQSPRNPERPKEDDSSPKGVQSPKEDKASPEESMLVVSEAIESPNDERNDIERYISPNEDVRSPKGTPSLLDVTGTKIPLPNGTHEVSNGAYFATVNFINENFEELLESNVDSQSEAPLSPLVDTKPVNIDPPISATQQNGHASERPKENGFKEGRSATERFLNNEQMFCQSAGYSIPLLGDIRFTGPGSEIMSTSFCQESPTEPSQPTLPTQPCQPNGAAADLLKDWDSDSDDSHATNSSSGEFIWKDGDGRETPVVPSYFDHQRDSHQHAPPGSGGSDASDASGDSGSGSEGDEVEFVPSSWDCRAAPSKSSLRSLEQAQTVAGPEGKKRVVFKRQKYHCVYEYPREAAALDDRPADYCTYAEWDAASAAAEEAELGYHQLYGGLPGLRAPVAAGSDYDDDFFITSSARPFESLGFSSQFFPGLHGLKAGVLEDLPPAPSTPSTTETFPPHPLDLITPDSGVEDITPAAEFDKKLPEELAQCWRAAESPSSSESASPGSPSEALGGLRHTRDKLKLDLPPSPHIPSPRIGKVFNFTLEKPKRNPAESVTPLVMTDETPVIAAIPLPEDVEDVPLPEPTFSTFGKSVPKAETEPKAIILNEQEEAVEVPVKPTETRGEGTVLDSGDEDSGIESSAKASLERKQPHVS